MAYPVKATIFATAVAFASPAAAEGIKIANIENFTGPGSTTNREYALAAKYWADTVNAAGGIKGNNIEYFEYDSQGSTATAAEKFRSAIADGAQIIVQSGSSGIAGQLTEDVRKHNLRNPEHPVVYLTAGAEALELTGEKCHFYFFRFAPNAAMRVKALITVMQKQGALGKKVFAINPNYSWGTDMQTSTEASAAAGGYAVVDTVLHETNKSQDFGPYVARMKSAGADTVITGSWGNDLILMMKEIDRTGLDVSFAAMFLDLPGMIENAGPSSAGYFAVETANREVGGEATEKLYADYAAKLGHTPSSSEVRTIFGMWALQAALEQVDVSGTLNVTDLAKALEAVSIDTPMGKIAVRAEDHQGALPLIVSQVSADAKFKRESLDIGLKPVSLVEGAASINPVQPSCKMQRP
ncbi:ABC transporter substrate-binding protein [Mesorhizobium sp.]|uniref:ABC transporter substrate-binding protein n=1 Tax=Mesorhizobium sp. TaxID=1871066 RepID=UPI000FE93A1F|nr:ABC transporter substrate-binding protein [Mesorhizobium sp.]RWM45500.1 MAG: branched-chain amino acid ABC transporter substrate-binding protein [Mesorhizobium sp.]RWM58180.1 MAG: branched-chain amino acid ABC transporter substrate-binding protein [Mesorhizobium sp.]RWM58655.1 MAG: branched-chain amino acid ABC transporter substrate-binding protein [Mesorhizobium sp.]TIO70046.1 MAG: branched-chain amino acid ABC transporter substrate-binding protein [Mesorhizobium sp.]TJV93935.1 MAG: branch